MKVSSNPKAQQDSVAALAKAWKGQGLSLLPGTLLTAGIAGTALVLSQASGLRQP